MSALSRISHLSFEHNFLFCPATRRRYAENLRLNTTNYAARRCLLKKRERQFRCPCRLIKPRNRLRRRSFACLLSSIQMVPLIKSSSELLFIKIDGILTRGLKGTYGEMTIIKLAGSSYFIPRTSSRHEVAQLDCLEMVRVND
ncbi:hypothetical protein AVEN_232185-1 [Araneus ventricosus]|uniref:Uncharacterized protein n=1 Tax=Araneus ventricosus TaxID=182803 RepID=A0A4Y2UYV9_ARAVE|nr:hypothetical protein AVEN_232185-1 [Araneus ventricosus]